MSQFISLGLVPHDALHHINKYFIYCDWCCRIDGHGVIKVADFGMSEDMYARNYFRHDKSEEGSEEKVPIRWMAPESIENGIYTERTDIVRQYSPLIKYIPAVHD